jgi:hypothetical protein
MKQAADLVEATTGGDAMTSRAFALALAAAVLLLAPQVVLAQASGYYSGSDNPVGPTVSPYLNLLGSNNFGVTNYQSLVRPLINQGSAIQNQGASLSNLQQAFGAQYYGGRRGGATTGHATFFMNYSHYYNLAPRR